MRLQPNPALTIEDFGEEIIMVNLRNGAYFSLKGTAPAIWRDLTSSPGIKETLAKVDAKYNLNSQAVADILNFLSQCLEDELILVPESELAEAASFTASTGNGKLAFSQPVYEKHTNMQDILLLDPIHDVSDLGWPHPKV